MLKLGTRYLAVLFASLCLFGCAEHAGRAGSGADAPDPGSASLPASSSSREQSSRQSSTTEPPTEGASVPAEDAVFFAQISEEISWLETEDFVSADALSRLAAMGVEARAENVRELDKRHISFELVMKAAERELRLPLTADCYYGRFDPEYFEGREVGNFRVEWGGLSALDGGTVAVSTLRDIRFYDAETLGETGPELALDAFAGADYYLLGARRDEALGIIVPAFWDGKDGFAFFNGDGSLRETQTFVFAGAGDGFFYSTVNEPTFGGPVLRDVDVFDVMRLDAPYIVFGDPDYTIFYNAEKKGVLGQSFDEMNETDGNRRVVMKRFDLGSGDYDAGLGEDVRLALYYEGEALRSGFFFSGEEISPSFGRANKENYPGLSYRWSAEEPIFAASCPFSDLTVALDFEKKAAALTYEIKPEHVEEAFAASPDGRYSLHNASRDGGGDVIFSSIVLRDGESGALRFLALSGGMYGGYGDAGFLSNGDIYVMALDSLRIFETGPGAPVPPRPFNLPLGRLEDGRMRYLFTFRRDPATFEYIVLYGEEPVGHAYNQTGEIPFEADYNYIVGFCDEEGSLTESFDTGAPVLGDPFGFKEMSFRLSGDRLEIIVEEGRGFEGKSGVFDLTTRTYSEAGA